jgi:hypothetical protein
VLGLGRARDLGQAPVRVVAQVAGPVAAVLAAAVLAAAVLAAAEPVAAGPVAAVLVAAGPVAAAAAAAPAVAEGAQNSPLSGFPLLPFAAQGESLRPVLAECGTPGFGVNRP